jgi:ribosomal protein L20
MLVSLGSKELYDYKSTMKEKDNYRKEWIIRIATKLEDIQQLNE